MHIAVVGTGIVGACSAAWLQRDGHQITFVDPLEPGQACSFGNAGSLSPSACLPVGMPNMWRKVPSWLLDPLGPLTIRTSYLPRVLPWLVRMLRHSTPKEVTRIAGSLVTLLRPIFECYEPLLEHAQAQSLVQRSGCLYVYSSREAAAQWKWGMDLRRSLGVNLIDVDREELETLEPDLKGRFRFGILAPDNGSTLDPSQLVQALCRQSLRDGARHDRRTVTGFERQGRRVTALRMDRGEPLAVDGVVIAAGAWSGTLAAQLGDRLPLESQRGYHVTVRSSNLQLRHTVMASENNLMVNPMAMGLRLAGTVEFAGLAPPPNYARAQALLRQGRQLFPHLDTADVTQWMGHRPCMPDSLPVIDHSRNADNAWLAFGHGHMGMCMGATTGREIAHLIAGRATQVDLAPFRAARFH
ncbi:MAG: FAD-dependent oxidoreductase [Rhodoferax sp.]|nr:FAD-dependent oxidoreductase [Rhodoferax sp.]MCP5260000.1 FAD-dependent oxidoreductase [Rhodoferax sp.]